MIKTIDEALGYLLRDPQSVEAEAGRVLLAEIHERGSEIEIWKRRAELAIAGPQPLTAAQIAYGRDVVAPRIIDAQVVERLAKQLYWAQMTALLPPSVWPQRGWDTLTEDQREGWRVAVAAREPGP